MPDSDPVPVIRFTYGSHEEARELFAPLLQFVGTFDGGLSIPKQDEAASAWGEACNVTILALLEAFVASHKQIAPVLDGIMSIDGTDNSREKDFTLKVFPSGGVQQFLSRVQAFQEQFGGSLGSLSFGGRESSEISLEGVDLLNLVEHRGDLPKVWGKITHLDAVDRSKKKDFTLKVVHGGKVRNFLSRVQAFQEQFGGSLGSLSFGESNEIGLEGVDLLNLFKYRGDLPKIWGKILHLRCGDWESADLQIRVQMTRRSEFFEQIERFLKELGPGVQLSSLSCSLSDEHRAGFNGDLGRLHKVPTAINVFENIVNLELKVRK